MLIFQSASFLVVCVPAYNKSLKVVAILAPQELMALNSYARAAVWSQTIVNPHKLTEDFLKTKDRMKYRITEKGIGVLTDPFRFI